MPCCSRGPSVEEMNWAPPIITAEVYNGMPKRMIKPQACCRNFELNRLAMRSGNVTAPSFWPISRVFFPKMTNAMNMPRAMLRTVSQIRPMPSCAATPPKPTMAEVLMKVAPYDSAISRGGTLRPASMKSCVSFVLLYPRYPSRSTMTRYTAVTAAKMIVSTTSLAPVLVPSPEPVQNASKCRHYSRNVCN